MSVEERTAREYKQSDIHHTGLRVVIIAENASYQFGGEAVLPMHYFRLLKARGVPVWMITNERNRSALQHTLSPADMTHLLFLPNDRLHRTLFLLKKRLPQSVGSFTIGQILEVVDQRRTVRLIRRVMPKHRFTIAHQPTPVSPKHVSVLWNRGWGGLGIPVVIGPMNGGVCFPPGFRGREHPLDRLFVTAGRALAGIVHRLLPGKLRAETLLCANLRTRRALPGGTRGHIVEIAENGVDLSLYRGVRRPHPKDDEPATRPVRFVFSGRLVDLKGVDLLIRAFARARSPVPMELHILGDGPCRAENEKLASSFGNIATRVMFHGWMSHRECAARMADSDVLVLPSLRECGGAAVLEAMAMRMPIIATNWGGPTDYVDPSCGILVDPVSPDQFINDLATAMVTLAESPERRAAMGEAGYQKVLRQYDWERKIDRMLEIYEETQARTNSRRAAAVISSSTPRPAATTVTATAEL